MSSDPWDNCLVLIVDWPKDWTPAGPFTEPDLCRARVRRLIDLCVPVARAARIAARFNGKQLVGARRFWAVVRDLGAIDEEQLDTLLEAEAATRLPHGPRRLAWWPPGAGGG